MYIDPRIISLAALVPFDLLVTLQIIDAVSVIQPKDMPIQSCPIVFITFGIPFDKNSLYCYR